ncbi:hypothetical protein BYT27DRAFT_7195886 [Phlegmacium glaucopus]|nr:hypothetical protein BYT27DRAFT_7195886 [Phlegmacium glaucopus]
MSQFKADNEKDLGAAFFGFVAGTVLFGITISQAFQYFMKYASDRKYRKQFVMYICFLDALHFALSTYMMYCLLVIPTENEISGTRVVWSFKAVGTIQTVVVISVQYFYLYQIWTLSGIQTIHRNIGRFVRVSVLTVLLYALGMGIVFLSHLERVTTILSFSGTFQDIIYLGLGSTAFIDCGIAGIMSVVLRKSSRTTSRRSIDLIRFLVLYFVGTGFLTAIAAVLAMSLYIAKPSTLLYLTVEFSIIRLYVNAILALFNSKDRLQKRMDESIELRIPSLLLFGDGVQATDQGTAEV